MLQSLEVDIYPLCDPRAADLIDGALGDGSQFHVAFGYYAHGVGPERRMGIRHVAQLHRARGWPAPEVPGIGEGIAVRVRASAAIERHIN